MNRAGAFLFAFFCTVVLILNGCENPAGDDSNRTSEIPIYSQSDLEKIGVEGNYPLAGTYALMNDISLVDWTPIGDNRSGGKGSRFTGKLYGNDHTITLQNFADLSLNYLGIFGYADGAEINKLTVRADLSGLTGTAADTAYVGTLIGYANDTALDNINAGGTLDFTAAGNLSIGGIAGYHKGNASSAEEGNHIKNSLSSVAVSGKADGVCAAGGINGTARYLVVSGCRSTANVSSSGTVFNVSSGGISGDAQKSVYTDCAYEGGTVEVGGKGEMAYAGGIVGRSGANSPNIGNELLRCSSGGTVSAAGTGDWPYAGGLIGYMHGNSKISESCSTAAVTGVGAEAYIGGLAGNCSQASIIENSYFNGNISHSGDTKGVGGITGQNGSEGSVVRYCYAAGTITNSVAGATVGGIVGQNAEYSGNDINSCAALQSAINNSGGTAVNTHRIAGTKGPGAALTNNIANSSMTGFTAGARGADTVEGADCDEKPAQSVYAGLGWNFTGVWKMGADYPVLQWQ
jgi:hypothetical protein